MYIIKMIFSINDNTFIYNLTGIDEFISFINIIFYYFKKLNKSSQFM